MWRRRTARRPGRRAARANRGRAVCAREVPLPETLYFRTGQVALAGCYPLANIDDLREMETLPRDRWVCRTAVPRADPRDDLVANALACALPSGVVVTWESERRELPDLMTNITALILDSVGVVRYSGPTPR